ncbi:MAG: large subunit ribosomal protein, partial [Patescibacteria group bacterium]|nr:large subunit ribosomal protein [Patescibacteria group bacterium]
TVTGTSKAKGFQGVVKRYNFKGGPRSHGQKHSERERGSSGGGPGRAGGRVVMGMRMPGRTGGDTVTVKGLKVVAVDASTNTIYISGAVPGRRGTVVKIIA